MITVDCSEMTLDDQLALASAISEGLRGRAFALVNDDRLVLDAMSKITPAEVASLITGFVSRRKEASYYSVKVDGDDIIVHTPDPLARSRGRRDPGEILPENLYKCPFYGCGFITPYHDLLVQHVRLH